MSTNNPNLEALDKGLPLPGQPPRRGWWSRNWLWFVPTLLLVMILLCCGCPGGIFFWVVNQVYKSEVFTTAMQKIQANDEVKHALGEPITTVRWPPPAFSVEQSGGRGETDIRWEIKGPKGSAKAHAKARLAGERWEMVILEVVLPDGKKVSLASAGGDDEAPAFEGGKSGSKESKPNAPPSPINLSMPPDDGPSK